MVSRKGLCLASALVAIALFLPAAGLTVPYPSYTYDFWAQRVPAPQAYVPCAEIYGFDLDIGPFQQPRDLKVGPDAAIYVADTGNHRIVVINDEWQLVQVIDRFYDHETGEEHTFRNPTGLSVTQDGELYVADRDRARIVHLTRYGDLIRVIGPPEPDVPGILPEDFRYRPSRVAVDRLGRIYVIAEDVYDGLLWFDRGGDFRGFLGAPRVTPTVADLFWSRIATEEQLARMRLVLPIEFSSIAVAPAGLLYVTLAGPPVDDSIRLLNPSGDDVLSRRGFHPPRGSLTAADSLVPEEGDLQRFVDIAGRSHGRYSVLERTYGRVFTYDALGNLLYVFGGIGDMEGLFRTPRAIDIVGERVLVLDNRRINVFEPTEYGHLIHGAIEAYNSGNFARATELWHEVLRHNANFDLAYSGIGRALYLQGDFEEAMRYFYLGQDRAGYSAAFAEYRRIRMGQHFGWIVLAAAVLVMSPILWPYLRYRLNLAVQRRQQERTG